MVLGYFGGPFLGVIDSSIIVIGSVFLIFLAFINYILSRVIDSKATTGIISFCSAVLIVYWGQDFIYNLMQGLNIDTGILSIIIGIVFFIGAIWIIRRVGFGGFFMIFGAGLIIVGFTDLVYRQGVVIILGGVLTIIGYWILRAGKRRKKLKGMGYWERRDYLREEKRRRQLNSIRTEEIGKKMGYGLAKGTYAAGRGIKKIFEKKNYKPGDTKEWKTKKELSS